MGKPLENAFQCHMPALHKGNVICPNKTHHGGHYQVPGFPYGLRLLKNFECDFLMLEDFEGGTSVHPSGGRFVFSHSHMSVGSTDGEQFSAVYGYDELAEHNVLASFSI